LKDLEGKDPLVVLGIGGKIILKGILKETWCEGVGRI
jgi:hypothetical protein